MNKCVFSGRLTRDPEIRYSQTDSSLAIAKYSLAVNRRKKKDNDAAEADYIPCTVFGKGAEFAERFLKKGMKIIVHGHIQSDHYTNKDGKEVYTLCCIAEEQEFAESKKETQDKPREDPLPFPDIPEDAGDELPFN